MNSHNEDRYRFIFAAVVVLAFVSIIGFFVWGKYFYRATVGVTIEDRWWSFGRRYCYDVTRGEPVTRTRTTVVNGKTQVETYVVLETKTTTYTRCQNERVGNELPPVAPEMPCEMQYGDYVREWVSYSITYKEWESDELKGAGIGPEMWPDLEPGGTYRLTLNLFSQVVAYERVGQ